MEINEPTARGILEAAHAAWNRRDIDAMLEWYHDDLTYFCNTGGSDGGALRLYGKADMRAFLSPVLNVADCISVPCSFTYQDGMGRAHIEVVLRHRKTGHTLQGTYRQLLFFRDFKISALEEFHDAARMKAFWAMVQGPQNEAHKNRTTVSRMLLNALKPQPRFPPLPTDE